MFKKKRGGGGERRRTLIHTIRSVDGKATPATRRQQHGSQKPAPFPPFRHSPCTLQGSQTQNTRVEGGRRRRRKRLKAACPGPLSLSPSPSATKHGPHPPQAPRAAADLPGPRSPPFLRPSNGVCARGAAAPRGPARPVSHFPSPGWGQGGARGTRSPPHGVPFSRYGCCCWRRGGAGPPGRLLLQAAVRGERLPHARLMAGAAPAWIFPASPAGAGRVGRGRPLPLWLGG